MSNAIIPATAFDLAPHSLSEAFELADRLAASNLVPSSFKGKSGDILVAMQWGMELGLKPLQSLQNIAVINGRPCLWGDAVIALARASSLCEYIDESVVNGVATCTVKRRGEAEQSRAFSTEDAKKAGLLGKAGPWTQYPNRMLQMRARAFALRDVFPDVLKGMQVAEEVADYPQGERDITPKARPADVAQAAIQQAVSDQAESAAELGISDHEKELAIMNLELKASQGIKPFRNEWTSLSEAMKAAIGITERNRIDKLALATVAPVGEVIDHE